MIRIIDNLDIPRLRLIYHYIYICFILNRPSTGLSAEFFERYSLPSNGLQQVGGRVVQERLRLRIQVLI